MKYQCEHSDIGICYECFQKTKDLCECGNNMHTEHDDRKFEVDGKEVCIICWANLMLPRTIPLFKDITTIQAYQVGYSQGAMDLAEKIVQTALDTKQEKSPNLTGRGSGEDSKLITKN